MWPPLKSFQLLRLELEIFRAARDGKPEVIKHLLTGRSPDLIKEVLHHHTETGNGRGTPLTIAALQGHLEVVQLLVEHFHVQCEPILISNPFFEHPTALMHAACGGYLEIVKCLVNNGSDVKQRNPLGQTPLFIACTNNHPEVVKYLVESGAQIDEVYTFHRSCLMVACEIRSEQIVQYLLEKGADVNRKDQHGMTSLHYAAMQDSSPIVKLLLKNGARICKNGKDLSPLIVAVDCRSTNVVDFFVGSSFVARKEKIDALELLGTQVADRDLDETFRYLRQAMVERHKDPADIISKPHSPLPTLSGAVESRTLEELEARKFDHDILRLECLAIVQRRFGWKSFSVFSKFFDYFLHLKSMARHSEALDILLHAMKNAQDLPRSWYFFYLNHFPSIFDDMLQNETSPCFYAVLEVLDLALTELQRDGNWRPMSKDNLVDICLQCVMVGLKVARGQDEGRLLKERTECLIHLRPSLCEGRSVLHKAAVSYWNSSWELNRVHDLPFDLLVSFLIQCGADVNAWDDQKNSPLHHIAHWSSVKPESEVLCRITRVLVEAGALVGVQNREGKTPLEMASTEAVAAILRQHAPVSLRSLAATAVVRHQIFYAGEIPRDLEEFVQYH